MAVHVISVFMVGLSSVWEVASSPCNFDSTRNFLDCNSRALHHVPIENVDFANAKGIDLSGNNFERIKNETFSQNSALKYLDLSDNGIAHLETGAFRGLCNLAILNLSRNEFEITPDVMTPELFEPLVALKEIRIQNVPTTHKWEGLDQTFGKLMNLTKLYIDFPSEFIFGNEFSKLTKLKTISTANRMRQDNKCTLGALKNSTFSALRGMNITELRLINCGIDTIENGTFDPLTSLDTLDLSDNMDIGLNQAINSLHPFQKKSEKREMKEIRLARLNNVTCKKDAQFVVHSASLVILLNTCIKSLDLSENYIYNSFTNVPEVFELSKCLQHFNMSYHSLRCVPEDLFKVVLALKVLKSADVSHGFGIPEVGGHYVQYSHPRPNLQESMGLRPYNLFIPSSLEKVDLSAVSTWTDLRVIVRVHNGGNLRSLSFAYNNLDKCVRSMIRGVDNLTEVDISGIRCSYIKKEYFQNLRNLKILSLSNSLELDVSNSSSTSFELLDVLENIDLSGNKIFELHPQLFQNNKRLLKINLARNSLQRLPSAISHLAGLQRLDISSNAFTYLQTDETALIDRWIVRASKEKPFLLIMDGNPLQCTCDTVLFIRWIENRKDNLDNPEDYTCLLSNGSRMAILEFSKRLRNFEVSCVSSTYIIISVVATATISILILLLVIMYRYRLNLRYWLYTRLQPPKDMFAEQEYVFDAFVAYTAEDREWVSQQLRPNLELRENTFKLCIHDRDFTPGKPIHENIVDKMRESRKILLIISQHFLESTYGPLEIEYAGMKCLSDGRDDIILCVLMEDIPVRQMPKALRNLWHKITFLKRSADLEEQVIFWRNLTNALH